MRGQVLQVARTSSCLGCTAGLPEALPSPGHCSPSQGDLSGSFLWCGLSLARVAELGLILVSQSVASGGEEVHALDAPHSLASVSTQLAGGAVMAVGTWTLAEKSDYISLLSSSTYSATAYILVVAGVVVMVTGILGCCATFKERRNLLRVVSFAFGGWGGRFSLFSLEQCWEGGETSWLCSSLTLFICPRANATKVSSS